MWKRQKKNQKEEQFARNKRFLRALALIFISLQFGAHAAPNYFYLNSNLLVAQKYNYELKLDKARLAINGELAENPENGASYYLLHFNAYLKAFVSEEPADYKSYLIEQQRAIAQIQKLKDSEAYKKFALADIYFYSATLKGKFDELYGAARDINKAHSLIEENHKLFPAFLPNNKTRGVLKIYFSTVPENYTWIINLLGIKGNLHEGLGLLRTIAYHDDKLEYAGIAKEASYLYSFALHQVAKQSGKAWTETLRCTKDYKYNLLSTFFRSNMALKLNRNEVALNILKVRPKDKEYESCYFFYYLLGTAKLNKQDPTAIDDFKIFQACFHGRNFIKSNYQKMSWYYFLSGDYNLAEYYKELIVKIGVSSTEDDKIATQYSKKPWPNKELLRTRLLYDGGYYTQAAGVISKIVLKELPNSNQKAEYCYRRGRISEKLGHTDLAMKFYEASSLYAIQSDEYYGAYASIYLGEYYAANGDKKMAKKYFDRALSFKNNREYVESLEQRAKLGLKNLK